MTPELVILFWEAWDDTMRAMPRRPVPHYGEVETYAFNKVVASFAEARGVEPRRLRHEMAARRRAGDGYAEALEHALALL